MIKVEKLGGAQCAAASFKGKTQLVDTELAMVRAAWLFHHAAIVSRFCWLCCLNHIQRDEID